MRYWRIRMKDGSRTDWFPNAWDRDEVGIWYGAWSADDFAAMPSTDDRVKYLNDLPAQRELNWPISSAYVDAAARFNGIHGEDWIFGYCGEHLCLARVTGEMQSLADHPLNTNGELFKYRRIGQKKRFHLRRLPDSFRLLASAGRGNVHEVHGTRSLVELLAAHTDEDGVNAAIAAMNSREWVKVLGPNSWESMCMGYLVRALGFAPTGLSLCGALAVFDMAGVDADNRRIFCPGQKKMNEEEKDPRFLAAGPGPH